MDIASMNRNTNMSTISMPSEVLANDVPRVLFKFCSLVMFKGTLIDLMMSSIYML